VGLVAVLVCWTAVAWAAVPQTLHYSGKLDTAGGAFTGTIEVTFDLYAGAGAKSSFWSETQAVAVQNGRFHAQLGSKTTLTPADVNVADLHLGVTVGTDDEMGKVPVASVAYAFRASEAANAATVGGQAASSFAGAVHNHPYAPLSHLHDYAASIHSHSYLSTGGGTLGGSLAMSSNKVTGLAAPTADADAATKAYVDAAGSGGGFSIKEVGCSNSATTGNNVQCAAACPAGMKIFHSYVNCHFQVLSDVAALTYVGEGFGLMEGSNYSCVRMHDAQDATIYFRAYTSKSAQNKQVNGEIWCITAS
jgi:hypothetical protein